MRGPPDLKSERAALAGSPVSQNQFPYTENLPKQSPTFKRKICAGFFSFCRATACTIAALAFAGCPR